MNPPEGNVAGNRRDFRYNVFVLLISRDYFNHFDIKTDDDWLDKLPMDVGSFRIVRAIGKAVRNVLLKIPYDIRALSDVVWAAMQNAPTELRPRTLCRSMHQLRHLLLADNDSHYNMISLLAVGMHFCMRLYKENDHEYFSDVFDGIALALEDLSSMDYLSELQSLFFFIMADADFFLTGDPVPAA